MTEIAAERVLDKRYKIVAPIGAGGSSQVYLANDTALNREVAIKVLDRAAAADGTLRKMFVKEARSLASLSHPSIVAVYDVGEVEGLPFIVMEHLPGGSLKQRLERTGPLAPMDAVTFTVDIANEKAATRLSTKKTGTRLSSRRSRRESARSRSSATAGPVPIRPTPHRRR